MCNAFPVLPGAPVGDIADQRLDSAETAELTLEDRVTERLKTYHRQLTGHDAKDDQ